MESVVASGGFAHCRLCICLSNLNSFNLHPLNWINCDCERDERLGVFIKFRSRAAVFAAAVVARGISDPHTHRRARWKMIRQPAGTQSPVSHARTALYSLCGCKYTSLSRARSHRCKLAVRCGTTWIAMNWCGASLRRLIGPPICLIWQCTCDLKRTV